MDFPPSLLAKLESENLQIGRDLATLNPSDVAPSMKIHAERRLLAMTPKALDVLDEGMGAGNTKDRVSAASKVLDLSPATKVQTTLLGEQSIPLEAIKSIFEGMAKMFSGAQVQFESAPLRNVNEEAAIATLNRNDTIANSADVSVYDILMPAQKAPRKKKLIVDCDLEEVPNETPRQPERTPRRAITPLARGNALRPDGAIHIDGLSTKKETKGQASKSPRRKKQH